MDKDVSEIMKIYKKKDEEAKKDWLGTTNEWFYSISSPKRKGSCAEKIAKDILLKSGVDVENKPKKKKGEKVDKKSKSDYDFLLNKKKVELKLSCDYMGKSSTFFQIRPWQDYEYLVFMIVEPEDVTMYSITKEDFKKYCKKVCDDKHSIIYAGGKKKMGILKERYGKNLFDHYDLFHWVKKTNESWPKGTKKLI